MNFQVDFRADFGILIETLENGGTTMRIHEQWAALKKELTDLFAGATMGEYGCTTQGGETIRGPHITVMIPAEQEKACPCCQHKTKHEIQRPTEKDISKLVGIMAKYLCDVSYDGESCRHVQHGGGIYGKGWYYEITLDKR